jgi:phosphoglycerate dehydrogenase-like enzyme
VLRRSTVLFLCAPLEASTRGLVGAPELAAMRADAVLVNPARGGLVDERAVLEALRARRIWGYGTDAFATEPAGSDADSVLLGEEARALNLVLTPHLAWISDTTKGNVRDMVAVNVRSWVEGKDRNRVV